MSEEAGAASPLGRYSPSGTESGLVRVELRGLPVLLLLAGREHHDSLVREFRLLALHGEVSSDDAPARFTRMVDVLGHRYAAAQARRDEEIDDAARRGELVIDQVAHVPPAAADAVAALRELMDEADEFCRASLLVTLARSPLQRRFSDWYFDQFADQLAGRPPVPWSGPLRP